MMDNTSNEDQETIREFLVESDENLSRLDLDMVELEKRPKDVALLGSIFRTIHTIKGACGFLAFSTLEGITHKAESLLSQLRDGKRELTPALVSLILETVDATRKVLASIEATGNEGSLHFEDLNERLRVAGQLDVDPETKSAPELPCMSVSPAPKTELPAVETSADLHEGAQHGKDEHIGDVEEEADRRAGKDRRAGEDRRNEGGRRDEDTILPQLTPTSGLGWCC
jgi:two-component system chemotaxis sensor kinase CheA